MYIINLYYTNIAKKVKTKKENQKMKRKVAEARTLMAVHTQVAQRIVQHIIKYGIKK